MRLNSKPHVTTNLPEIECDVSAIQAIAKRVDVKGRLAIVIDDGIATGATTRGAMRANAYAEPKNLCLRSQSRPRTRSWPCRTRR